MIKNYFKIALRNLLKFKGFSIINILGLAMGIACFVLIALYVTDELSYDRFNANADRIFRINSDIRFGGTDMHMAVSADPMGAVLKKDYPQVEEYVRLYSSSGPRLIKKGSEYINETRITFADSTFLKVFTMPVLAGESKNFLTEPNTVAITETIAKKYFGDIQGAVGKMIETSGANPELFKVTTVLQDMPHNSHFIYDFIFSMANVRYDFGNFLSHNFHTYILLRPGSDYKSFNKNFDQVINNYVFPQAQQYMQIESMDDFAKSGNQLQYSLMPIRDIHLHSSRAVELGANGNIQYIYIFSAIAFFILLIACINFMNLSTARSAGRAKEVGIRKVLGTGKKSLIGQFLTESILMAWIATILAVIIIWFCMPWFNSTAGKQIGFSILFKPENLLFLAILPIIVGILAGSYPAFYLSSFQPIAVLKGKLSLGSKNLGFRNFLVVFQFATSIMLIIATIIVYQQLKYIQTINLGFNKDQVLVVDNPGIRGANREVFKNEIGKLSGVKSASFAGYLPVSNSSRNDNTFSPEAVMSEKNGFNMQSWNVDYDYVPTLGMEIINGRNFSPAFGSDSTAIIINESTAKVLGFDDPIGKKLYTNDGGDPLNTTILTIIGVVKNFNYESLRKNIGPLSFRLGNNRWATAYRIDTKEIAQLIKNIELKYKDMAPGMPFNYQFLDDSFDDMYREEQRVGSVSLIFAIFAIIIACMGLLGLATYTAEQRTKEIGIRKVLGATLSNIVTLLSKDFIRMVFFAIIIAVPIAWFAMHKWLEEFAFRMSMGIWIFILAGASAILIALFTVSFQAIKSAVMNPVKSLRTE